MYMVSYTMPDSGNREYELEFSDKLQAQLKAQGVQEDGGYADIHDAEGNEIDPWDVEY